MRSEPKGWLLTVDPAITEAGLIIEALQIRPDPTHGTPREGLTATILESIRLPTVRAHTIASLEQFILTGQAELEAVDPSDPIHTVAATHLKRAEMRAANAKDGKPKRVQRKRPRTWTAQAETAIRLSRTAIEEKTSIYEHLEREWQLSHEGARSRIRVLKKKKYLLGRAPNFIAGPELQLLRSHPKE
jgi:hypothetical protein